MSTYEEKEAANKVLARMLKIEEVEAQYPADNKRKWCGAFYDKAHWPGIYCVRPVGHSGPHVDHILGGVTFRIWENEGDMENGSGSR